MKKNILLGLIAAAGLASASADTQVAYVCGSTAFQGSFINAITNSAAAKGLAGSVIASDNSAPASATNVLMCYTNVTGGVTHTNLVNCHFTGSEGGYQVVTAPTTNPVTITFFPNTESGFPGTVSPQSDSSVSLSANIAMCDTYQASGLFIGKTKSGDPIGRNYTAITPATAGGTNVVNSVNDAIVAVQGFAFVGCSNYPTSMGTNMTADVFQTLYSASVVSGDAFSGSAADHTKAVFAVGRNADSGTRVTVQTVTGFGGVANPQQCQIPNATTVNLYPAESVLGVPFQAGQSGYSSTGGVLGALAITIANNATIDGNILLSFTPTAYYSVGYVAASKCKNGFNVSTGAGGGGTPAAQGFVAFTYTGVAANNANILQGSYPLWAYEHIIKSPNFSNTGSANIWNDIATKLQSWGTADYNANGVVAYTDIRATRSADNAKLIYQY